jgi:hypothetical protein
VLVRNAVKQYVVWITPVVATAVSAVYAAFDEANFRRIFVKLLMAMQKASYPDW